MTYNEVNFRNMVYYNREELRRILGGELAVEVLSTHARRGLRNLGILKLGYMKSGRSLTLTVEAEQELQTHVNTP